MIPIIALVGRPNTGKSTLFNKLIRKNHAITSDIAGTTRDRIYMHTTFNDEPAVLVDTGGITFKGEETFDDKITEQAALAIAEADIILFVLDSSEPLLENDMAAAQMLRKTNKPIVIIGNKTDKKGSNENQHELFSLGLGEPQLTAAVSNAGLLKLRNKVSAQIRAWRRTMGGTGEEGEVTTKDRIKIGFIGKPNVGKSSLINKLLGKDQVIVSDISGTTRDSTYLDFTYNDQELSLVDTAGIRRRGKQQGIERFSVFRTLRSIHQVDVALLIIDGEDGLAKQDMHVSEFILQAHKGMVIVVNKADLLKPEEKNRLLAIMQHRMQYAPWAPVLFTSAKTGTNITKVLDLSLEIYQERGKRIGTSDLNHFIRRITLLHPPKSNSDKTPKVRFATQPEVHPPQFVFFCRHQDKLHFSYKRYLENRLREEYGFVGTAIKMEFKEGSGKAADFTKKRTRKKPRK